LYPAITSPFMKRQYLTTLGKEQGSGEEEKQKDGRKNTGTKFST